MAAPPWLPYPNRRPPQRGLAAAIVIAAVLIAAALVTAALIVNRQNTAADTKAAVDAASSNSADSATCQAWKATYADLQAIPALPAGWTWDTPNIDTDIKKASDAVNRTLNLFAAAIAPQPAIVAAAALDYIAAKRTEMGMLVNHTYTDAVSVDVTLKTLNQLCKL